MEDGGKVEYSVDSPLRDSHPQNVVCTNDSSLYLVLIDLYPLHARIGEISSSTGFGSRAANQTDPTSGSLNI